MSNRGDQVIGELRRRLTALVAELGITYDEYRTALQWLIEVGQAGEWPLVVGLFEHAVEEQAHKNRVGSQGTVLGPFYLPDSPVLGPPYELPHRPDEKGRSAADYRAGALGRRHPAARRRAGCLAQRRGGALLRVL
jgi:catechol 1,2-dioxygenase